MGNQVNCFARSFVIFLLTKHHACDKIKTDGMAENVECTAEMRSVYVFLAGKREGK
jgi:hypothetical protein